MGFPDRGAEGVGVAWLSQEGIKGGVPGELWGVCVRCAGMLCVFCMIGHNVVVVVVWSVTLDTSETGLDTVFWLPVVYLLNLFSAITASCVHMPIGVRLC